MSFYVIADEDTVLGFRYAGVAGEAVESPAAAREALERACRAGRYGIVILTDQVADSIRDEVNRVRFVQQEPVVVEIPGPKGPSPMRPDLMKLIQEAVGVRL
jgi:V/A-type H+/Na+-transporting ATPase subunit F